MWRTSFNVREYNASCMFNPFANDVNGRIPSKTRQMLYTLQPEQWNTHFTKI